MRAEREERVGVVWCCGVLCCVFVLFWCVVLCEKGLCCLGEWADAKKKGDILFFGFV